MADVIARVYIYPPGEWREFRPRKRRTKVSVPVDVQCRMIEAYFERGASLRSVAAETTYHDATVRAVLLDAGVPLRKRGGGKPRTSVEDQLHVGELYASGLTLDEIAREIGVCRATVQRRLALLDGRKRSRSEAMRLSLARRRAQSRSTEQEAA